MRVIIPFPQAAEHTDHTLHTQSTGHGFKVQFLGEPGHAMPPYAAGVTLIIL